jgi:hypothetical protein
MIKSNCWPRTAGAVAAVHIELAPEECKAVAIPGRGRRARRRGGEVRPADVGGVVDVEVVEETCNDIRNHSGAGKCVRAS